MRYGNHQIFRDRFWMPFLAVAIAMNIPYVAFAQAGPRVCFESINNAPNSFVLYVSKVFQSNNPPGSSSDYSQIAAGPDGTPNGYEGNVQHNPDADAFAKAFHDAHPNEVPSGYIVCETPEQFHADNDTPPTAYQQTLVPFNWPSPNHSRATQISVIESSNTPQVSAASPDKSALKVNQCISVTSETGQYSPTQLYNRCNFDVQVSYCFRNAPQNLFSCEDQRSSIGGSANINAGGYMALQEPQPVGTHHVLWVACRGEPGDVLPLIKRVNGALKGYCR